MNAQLLSYFAKRMNRIFATYLIFSLMLPSVMQIAHSIQGHFEIHCNEDIPNHFHQAEFDCDYNKFFTFQYTLEPDFEVSRTYSLIHKVSVDFNWMTPEAQSVGEIRLRAPPGFITPRA